MKDKKTLRELFEEARRAGHDSFGIANDPNMLEIIKKLAEKRGDFEHAKEIEIQIEKLRAPSTERIIEILKKDRVYYSATRLSITALYDWDDIKEDLTNLIDKKERKRPVPKEWAICRETDEIDIENLYDADRPFTLHIPMEHFDNIEDAVNRFNYLYSRELDGKDTSKRCGDCSYFDNGCNHPESYEGGFIFPKDIACSEYNYEEKEEI